MRRCPPAILAAATFALTCCLCIAFPSRALAQQYEKVEGPLRESLSPTPFIVGAYGFIWVSVLVYVIFVGRGLRRVEADLDLLRAQLDKSTPKRPA